MTCEIRNIATVNQIAEICSYTDTNVRIAIGENRLTITYPFPNTCKKNDRSGQQFIVCDEKLVEFLGDATRNARRKKGVKTYNPVTVAKRYFEFIG